MTDPNCPDVTQERWMLGGPYGALGVEVVAADATGVPLAVVNRVQANRIKTLAAPLPAGATAHDRAWRERERTALEAGLPAAIARARLMAAAPTLYRALATADATVAFPPEVAALVTAALAAADGSAPEEPEP